MVNYGDVCGSITAIGYRRWMMRLMPWVTHPSDHPWAEAKSLLFAFCSVYLGVYTPQLPMSMSIYVICIIWNSIWTILNWPKIFMGFIHGQHTIVFHGLHVTSQQSTLAGEAITWHSNRKLSLEAGASVFDAPMLLFKSACFDMFCLSTWEIWCPCSELYSPVDTFFFSFLYSPNSFKFWFDRVSRSRKQEKRKVWHWCSWESSSSLSWT